MNAGHRWLGRWKLQVCASCGARSRQPGVQARREFSVGTGAWTTQVPECRPEHDYVEERPREVCPAHLEPEPCSTCSAYVAAGL